MTRSYEKDRSDLRERVITKGCFAREENERIYQKYYATAPRYLFRAVDRKYDISSKDICDVGCSFGMNLVFCTPQSYGIEVADYPAKFARSLGLTVYTDNIFTTILDLPKVDVVWCSALMEHVDSPHILMLKLSQLLRPNGLVIIYVPTIPIMGWLGRIPALKRYIRGYLHSDHINGFVPETLQFICERAGFKTLEVSPFYPAPLSMLNHVPLMNRLISGCVFVGQKIADWNYPRGSTRRVANNESGYTQLDETFDPEVWGAHLEH
jgi:2-polyprenyl-3-methyl-5-hydroxy-6-metoxy-1,4-benzoquinol methylase